MHHTQVGGITMFLKLACFTPHDTAVNAVVSEEGPRGCVLHAAVLVKLINPMSGNAIINDNNLV